MCHDCFVRVQAEIMLKFCNKDLAVVKSNSADTKTKYYEFEDKQVSVGRT